MNTTRASTAASVDSSPAGVSANGPRARARASAAAPSPILLRKPEAAAVMGMSLDSYEKYVQPEIRVVRRGVLVLAPVAELERWAVENAERTLP